MGRAGGVVIGLVIWFMAGCGMFGAWKSIPPPGGCDQCHSARIGSNWEVAITAATVTDETGRHPWQRSESVLPKEPSPLEEQKITEQRCFRCHKGPDKLHSGYKGRYHH